MLEAEQNVHQFKRFFTVLSGSVSVLEFQQDRKKLPKNADLLWCDKMIICLMSQMRQQPKTDQQAIKEKAQSCNWKKFHFISS